MTKIDLFKTWGEQITVTNRTINVKTIAHYDELWYCIESGSGCYDDDMMDIYNHCKGVGDEIHFIDGHLYFNRDAFFNIDLMFIKYDFITI